MAEDEAALLAEGWEPLPTVRYSAAVGPTYMKGAPGKRTVLLLTDERVANDHMGNVHGGALMTFADIALGVAASDAVGGPRIATAQMQFQFVAGSKAGVRITCEPEIVRQTRQLIFTRGLFKVDDHVIGSADAIFKVFPKLEG